MEISPAKIEMLPYQKLGFTGASFLVFRRGTTKPLGSMYVIFTYIWLIFT